MRRFEYKTITTKTLIPDEEMREIGWGGWELKTIIYNNDGDYIYFFINEHIYHE